MSSGDQGQPQGQGRPDEGQGRHDGGAREQIQNVGRRIQEGAEQASQRLRKGLDSARDEAARRYRRVEGTIARNPAPSVLLGFGIGFGLGLILTTMLVGEEETWAERHLPDSIRRRIPDSLRQAPDKISELADAIRDLPDQIARRLPSSLRG